MIDKNITRRAAKTMDAVARWLRDTAMDIDYASRVLNRIQYDRPWGTPACCGEGSGQSGPASGG